MNRSDNLLKDVLRKGLAVAMSASLIAVMIPTAVQAEEPKSITAFNGEEKNEDNIGDVTRDVGEGPALQIIAGTNGIANNTGKVTAVAGDVTNTSLGGGGVTVGTFNNGSESTITTGNISGTMLGMNVSSMSGGKSDVTVNGNVTASSGAYTWHVIGASSSGGGKTDITVNGDVLSEKNTGKDTSEGIVLSTSKEGSETNITVNGNVTAKEGNAIHVNGTGAKASLIPGTSTIQVEYINSSEGGKANVLVTETVKAEDENAYGVVSQIENENLTVTVWKIEPNKDGSVAARETVSYAGTQVQKTVEHDEELEKKIQYIVKVEQPASGATLSATDANGGALNKTGDYEWAHEGDRVLLKVDVHDGYELKGAYNGKGEKIALLKDANGNYYIDVPKGGGVYFSVELSEKAKGSGDDSNPVSVSVAAANNNATTQVVSTSLTQRILNAAQGENIQFTTTDKTSLTKEEVDALKIRADVSLTLFFTVNGVMYKITIPAGADLDPYRNADGGIDYITLATLYGATPV